MYHIQLKKKESPFFILLVELELHLRYASLLSTLLMSNNPLQVSLAVFLDLFRVSFRIFRKP